MGCLYSLKVWNLLGRGGRNTVRIKAEDDSVLHTQQNRHTEELAAIARANVL